MVQGQLKKILLLCIGVRILLLVALPARALSLDLLRFESVFLELAKGNNPYITTTFVNYAPLWPQLLWLLGSAAEVFQVPLLLLIRLLFIAAEALLLVLVWNALPSQISTETKKKSFLWGWVLNPLPLLLTVQHAHFDLLMVLCCVLFFIWSILFIKTEDSVDWLLSCFWLGVGVALKTVPLVLIPIALSGFQIIKRVHTRSLGVMLICGTTALTLGSVFILAPADISEKVLLYTSVPGYFGVTGLLSLCGASSFIPVYRELFFLFLMLDLCIASAALTKSVRLGYEELLSLIIFQFAALIAFGPGYGPQYLYWLFPFVLMRVTTHINLGNRFLTMPAGFFLIVAGVTSLIEYALIPSLGGYLLHSYPNSSVQELSALLNSPSGQTLLRIPLWGALLVLVYGERVQVLRVLRLLKRGKSDGHL